MKHPTLFLVFTFLVSMAVSAAANEYGCWDVAGTGPTMTTADPDTGYFRGDFPVVIGGRNLTIDSQSLTVGTLQVDATSGVVNQRLSHLWRIKENGQKMVTFDDFTLTPTDDPDVLDALVRFEVVSGGRFNCGEVIATGIVDLTIPAFVHRESDTFTGRLCDCRRGSRED